MIFLKIIFSLIFTFFIYALAFTADDHCGTESLDSATFVNLPWIENNQFLVNLVDSIEGSCNNCRIANDGLSAKKYQVPIKAVVYYHTNYPGITDNQVQQYIREVNRYFDENRVGIQFYLVCEVSRILSFNAYIDSEAKKNHVLSSFLHPNAITVHFVHSRNEQAPGSALLPYTIGDRYSCYVITGGTYTRDHANTLAHELGHTLGLSHTHDKGKFSSKDNAKCNNCNQESVNKNRNQEGYCWLKFSWGKKCDRNGDGLCDTDADPNWSEKGKIELDCNTYTYTGGDSDYEKDNYGDYWGSLGNNNAMRNIMSYSRSSCRNEFTTMQKGVMYYSLLKSGLTGAQSNAAKFRINPDLDNYEPDNYWFDVDDFVNHGVLANEIVLNTQQYHTFHHSNNSSDNWSACDVDWVYFYNNTGSARDFYIQTLEVSGKPKPDTKITLYNVWANGVLGSQIATHDDNATDKFSKITRNLATGYYAVKVENKITDVSLEGSKGHYYIRVDVCYDKSNTKVTGANAICGASQTYYVSNIPVGATVTWFQTHNDLTLTPSGNSCIVGARTRGDVNLYAVVSFCGMLDTFVKTIAINMPQYVYYASGSYRTAYPDVFDEIGLNTQCYRNIGGSMEYTAHYENYNSITWTKLSSYPTGTSALWSSNVGGDPRKISVHLRAANASLTLKADVTNACGTISNTYTFLSNGVSCPAAMMRGVSEPLEIDYYDVYVSHQTLAITYKDEEENKSELAKIILSDKMGNILLEKTDAAIKENTIQIDMSSYKSDNYYIILQYADGNIEPQQVAKF